LRFFLDFLVVFVSLSFGLTMSEEGGFDELEEFFSDLESFSPSSIRRLSSSAIFTAASSHPRHFCLRPAMMTG
jgi:hypothetical protein